MNQFYKAMYKNVYVIGVFDLFHRGHLELLKKAKALGEKLIVGVNSDTKVACYKRKPVCSEDDRLELVKGCKYVDHAFIIHDFEQRNYIEKYNIDVIVHGDEWQRASYMKQICVTEEYLKKQKTDLVLLPYTHGISTTQLIQRIVTMHTLAIADKELFY